MRENIYIRLTLPVLVVCIVASAGLAATYAVTKGPIAATDKANEEKALKAVLPEADKFPKVADSIVEPKVNPKMLAAIDKASPETPVVAVYRATSGSQQIGWGVKVTPRGYGGPIAMVVGLDSDGKVTGVSIVTANETPGLGSKAVGPDEESVGFLTSFVDASDPVEVADIDTITGATKSSRGVRKGVEAALSVFEGVLSKEGGAK